MGESVTEPRYFVDTEHVRGERRTYWVADKHRTTRGFPGRKVTDVTYDMRKAARQCAEMNQHVVEEVPPKEKLSPMQRRILTVMETRGPAAFTGERARVDGFGVFDAKHGGVIIRAYQSPQWFLKQRGLIAVLERMCPGTWYEITDKGRKALG